MKRKQLKRKARRNSRPVRQRRQKRNARVTPRTKASKNARSRARRALARVRRGESFSAAIRAEHIGSKTALKHIGRFLRRARSKGGKTRYVPIKSKRVIPMRMLTQHGYVPVSVGSRDASLLGKHSAAIKKFLRTGDASVLAPFVGRRVAGRELVTDPQVLSVLADAGELRLDELYR